MNSRNPILVIRFSSFGDIVQSLYSVAYLKNQYSTHFVTRSDFSDFLKQCKDITKVHSFNRSSGFLGLIRLAFDLRALNYEFVYDAHNNLRSRILCLIIGFLKPTQIIRRSKHRWKRFLLFKLRKNHFRWPFRGGQSFLEPLGTDIDVEHLSLSFKDIAPPSEAGEVYSVICPFASWPLKILPDERWREFLESKPNERFVVARGPKDIFSSALLEQFSDRLIDLPDSLSWSLTLGLLQKAQAVFGVDTGTTHLADLLGKPTHFFIGPSAFGYPARKSSRVHETELPCKPCSKDGRGRCTNKKYQKCMWDLPLEIQP